MDEKGRGVAKPPAADSIRPNAVPGTPAPPAAHINDKDLLTFDDAEAQARWTYYSLLQSIGGASAQDAQAFADAALKVAQGIVILDPSMVAPQGVPRDAMYPPKPQIQMDKTATSASRPNG